MRLKTYLSFRPTWTKVADALFALKVPTSEYNVDPKVRTNIFLQSWQTYKNKSQIPRLKTLIDTAKKYGLRIEGIAFSRDILRSMPIWYHKEAHPQICSMNTTRASICLQRKHGIRTVGDALDLANKCQGPDHQAISTCPGEGCEDIRARYNCKHPNGCINQARKLLDMLPPKWDPRSELPEDYEQKPTANGNDSEEKVIPFDRRVTTSGTLAEIFRIFTDENVQPSNQVPLLRQTIDEPRMITVATDGSCEHNGEENARAGAGIFITNWCSKNKSLKLPRYLPQSNQTGELVAAKVA
ncbi:hypothetical protein DFJ43DRAFT_985430, partial [Lentinula guzmanii]